MLLELVAIGQLVTFGPEGVERYCVTRYVIDEPAIEFADQEGTWRRAAGHWIMIRNAGSCRGAVEPGSADGPLDPGEEQSRLGHQAPPA